MKLNKVLIVILATIGFLLNIIFFIILFVFKVNYEVAILMILMLESVLFYFMSINRSMKLKHVEIENLKNEILDLKKRVGDIKE